MSFLFDRKGTMMMKTQFVFQRRLASAPQVSSARARAGDARKQKTGRFHLGMRAGCGQQKTVPAALSRYRPHGNQVETKMKYSFWALRTAGADVKRGWRILGRVWQHGFPCASAGWSANSRYTAHARSAAGILPVLRLPRTLGAAAYAAPAAMIAKPIYNRDRYQSLPDSLLLRA